jgi:PKD repeat protein
VKFKPQVSGAYCFAFTLNTHVNYSGLVAIEDFNITAPGLVNRPTASFAFGGLFEIMESKMLVFENQKASLVNLSKDADSYEWAVEYPSGTTYYSELETPEFEFNESGEYTVTLTATNVRTSRTTSRTVTVEYVDYVSESLSLMTWNPIQDGLLERGSIPSFAANGNEEYNYDFVTGYNRYYRKFAERFELPEGTKLNISSLSTWMAHYKNTPFTSGYDSEFPFEVVFYGETDGKLDENKVFARITSTLKEIFGNSGIGSGAGEGRSINFVDVYGDPIAVEGTFYIAFEFSEDMVITAYDPNIGRSYFATNVVKHATGVSTLYVKPHAVPYNSAVTADGNWYPVDQLDNTKKGLGAYFILWANNKSGEVAINALGETIFAARVDGGNLIVSGTQADEIVRVFDANGKLVASAVGRENSTVISIENLKGGIYIVNTLAGTSKFVK